MPASEILLTGANGYLGYRLGNRLLRETDYDLRLCINASTREEFERKSSELSSKFGGNQERLKFSACDLATNEPFKTIDPAPIYQIIHSAAVTRFNVEAETADLVNAKGSEKTFDFARRCGGLSQFLFLSTIYAAGLHSGKIEEKALDGQAGFANHYERSKWQAESVLLERYAELPFNILRIATVISDNEQGSVTQYNAFHNTLKLFYYGLLSLFPGDPQSPLYFVTGDFVEDACFSVSQSKLEKQILHVCHSVAESAKLSELLDIVFMAFEQFPDFKNRRILRPLWADAESFNLLADGLNSLSGSGIVNQAVSSVAPFSKQLFVHKEFCNDNLRAVLPAYSAPSPSKLIENTALFLAGTKWGRELQHAN